MARLVKMAVYGLSSLILAFLVSGGLPLLKKHAVELVVFACFTTGILLIGYSVSRNRPGK